MSYTPPAGNALSFTAGILYTPPVGNEVLFQEVVEGGSVKLPSLSYEGSTTYVFPIVSSGSYSLSLLYPQVSATATAKQMWGEYSLRSLMVTGVATNTSEVHCSGDVTLPQVQLDSNTGLTANVNYQFPSLSYTGYSGAYGSYSLSSLKIEGTASGSFIGYGDYKLPSIGVNGSTGLYGDYSFSTLSVDATATVGNLGYCDYILKTPVINASGYSNNITYGDYTLPSFISKVTATILNPNSGDYRLKNLVVNGSCLAGKVMSSSYRLSKMSIRATAINILKITNDGDYTLPMVGYEGRVGSSSSILRYKRCF